MNCKYCIDELRFKVVIADIETRCQYHKKKGQIYPDSTIVPNGMCKELFYAAYPASLAILYNGLPVCGRPRRKGIQERIAVCPAPEGIKVKIRSEEILPPPLRVMKELVEELCKKFYRPFNAPFRRVIIEVIEAGSRCPKGYKKGDIFRFNTGKINELCPAGFAAIYPFLRTLKGEIFVHCPDYVGVTYGITPD